MALQGCTLAFSLTLFKTCQVEIASIPSGANAWAVDLKKSACRSSPGR